MEKSRLFRGSITRKEGANGLCAPKKANKELPCKRGAIHACPLVKRNSLLTSRSREKRMKEKKPF